MILIDVRTAEEFLEQHADGAENFPLQNLQNGSLPDYPLSSEITLYCRSGGRSEMALRIMKGRGFTNVKNGGGLADVMGANL
jgi:phage shock protein E